jgi:acylphosphatase
MAFPRKNAVTTGKRVLYTGQVQGVGFRYTTRHVAANFAVAGYVRNLPDGRVELVAEGEPEEVEHFLDAVGQKMAGYIEERAIEDEPPCGYRGFIVRG